MFEPKHPCREADADEALQAALPALESAARALEEMGFCEVKAMSL